MSISLLIEIQNEVRRLLIAGSGLAAGDFRLKKLLPQMKESGKNVPVFARVADVLEKLIDSMQEEASERLLELSNLVSAVLYTQGETGAPGSSTEYEVVGLSIPTGLPYRRLKPVIDALTTKGSGRLEIIREAYQEDTFKDLRLIDPLIDALEDPYTEISDLAFSMLVDYGEALVPVLRRKIRLDGGRGEARKIELISKFIGAAGKDFYLEAAEKGSVDVRSAAVKALKDIPDCEGFLLDYSKDRRKEVREASLYSLAHIGSEAAVRRLLEVLRSKESYIAVKPIRKSKAEGFIPPILSEGEQALEELLKSGKSISVLVKDTETPLKEAIERLYYVLESIEGKTNPPVFDFLKKCLEHTEHLRQVKVNIDGVNISDQTIAAITAKNLLYLNTWEALELLEETNGRYDNYLITFAFEAALRVKNSSYVFEQYAGYLKNGGKNMEAREILRTMNLYVDFEEAYRLPEVYEMRRYDSYTGDSHDHTIRWDRRWLKSLIDLDELELVCRLASPEEPKCTQYLLEKLESHKNLNDDRLRDIVRGLMQAGYSGMMDVIIKTLEFNFKNTGHYMNYYLNEFIKVLKLLPPEYEAELEQFASRMDHESADKLLEVVYELKCKNKIRGRDNDCNK